MRKNTFWMYARGARKVLNIAKHDIIDIAVRDTPPIPPMTFTASGLVWIYVTALDTLPLIPPAATGELLLGLLPGLPACAPIVDIWTDGIYDSEIARLKIYEAFADVICTN